MPRGLAEIRGLLVSIAEDLAHIEKRENRAPDLPTDDGPIVSLKEAARRTGWKVERIKALIVRHRRAHPDEPALGYQPGGVGNAPWCVPLHRLEAVIRTPKAPTDTNQHQRTQLPAPRRGR